MVGELADKGQKMMGAKLEQSSPVERYRAARLVASNATDRDDCARLLDILGLTAEEGKHEPQPGEAEVVQDPLQDADGS